jgi:hypothetical protein
MKLTNPEFGPSALGLIITRKFPIFRISVTRNAVAIIDPDLDRRMVQENV